MRPILKDSPTDLTDACVLAAVLAVAILLAFLIAAQPGVCLKNCFGNQGRFVVMPRNCYLKIP